MRRFGPCTATHAAWADWRMDGGVTTVAMEAPGGAWLPLCARLEARGGPGLLIAPRHALRAPGPPQPDRLACTWLHRLHAYGLLAGACRPAEQVYVWRSSLRHRQMLLPAAAHHMPHMPTAVPHLPLNLPQVVREITGGTGLARIHASIAGARPPQRLAQLRTPHCPHAADASTLTP